MKQFLMAFCTLLALNFVAVSQTSDPWTGNLAESFAGGTGTADDPYRITNGAELAYLAKQTENSDCAGKYYRLENDLDMGGALETPSNWTSMAANWMNAFKGVFDGNGKQLHNFYQDVTTVGGLFANLGDGGVVKNLTIASGSVSATGKCGAIASGYTSMGGNPAKIENCYNYADVTGKGTNAVGGIIADAQSLVRRCVNYGTVKGFKEVGGIVGIFNVGQEKFNDSAGIVECVNMGAVVLPGNSTQEVKLGGIVGHFKGRGSRLYDCANFGRIDIGGFSGARNVTFASGLIGWIDNTNIMVRIHNSFTAAPVYANRELSSIFSATSTALINAENVYSDLQISAQYKASLTGVYEGTYSVPTDTLTRAAGLPGFDADVWQFSENAYPILKCFADRNDIKIATAVPHLSYTTADIFDAFNSVKSDFRLPAVHSTSWSVVKGATVQIEDGVAKVNRLAEKSDTVILRAKMGDQEKDYMFVVLMTAVSLHIEKPEHGRLQVFKGETELLDNSPVEENTELRMLAIPDSGYLLDHYLVDGEVWHAPIFVVTGETTVSAVFMEDKDPQPWDGTVATRFGGGIGTAECPYEIRTPAELAFLSQSVNEGNDYDGKYFVIVFNLDLNRYEWTPIGKLVGSETYGFAGKLDGRDRTIKNMSIQSCGEVYVGLFGNAALNSQQKNIILDSAYIKVENDGALVGLLVGFSSSVIENCHVSGRIEGMAHTVGGMCGSAGMSVTKSTSRTDIHVQAMNAGGFAGTTRQSHLEDCANLGDSVIVDGIVSENVKIGGVAGGLVGTGSAGRILRCYNTAFVSGMNSYAGGVAGSYSTSSASSSSLMSQCYNSGNVEGDKAGGIVGFCAGQITRSMNAGDVCGEKHAGGLVSDFNAVDVIIEEMYNIGDISVVDPGGYVGECIGIVYNGNYRNIYFDKQIKPDVSAIGGRSYERAGLLTSALTSTLPEGFDKNVWDSIDGRYPLLKSVPVSDVLYLKSAALMLSATSASVYDTPKKMRFNARVFTAEGLSWEVKKGVSATLVDDTLKVVSLAQVDTVVVEASYAGLVKSYTLFVVPLRYVLTLNQPTGGTVAAATLDGQSIASGSELSPATKVVLSYTEADGYRFVEWFDHTTGETDTVSMTEDKTVTAVFAKKTFTIKALASAGGQITPTGETTVEYGASQVYTILPEDGFEGDSLIVDGAAVSFTSTYTFTNIRENHSIRVVFKAKTFKISATCGEHGSISPKGDTLIAYGGGITYTITADNGYKLGKLTVDDVEMDLVETYTFNRVVAPHTIHAVFVVDNVAVEDVLARNIEVRARDRQLMVSNRTGDAVQTILYNVSGVAVGTKRIASGATVYMPLPTDGMYMLRITDGRATVIKKVMSL